MTSKRGKKEFCACKDEIIQLVEKEGYSYAKVYRHLADQGKITVSQRQFTKICHDQKIIIKSFGELAGLLGNVSPQKKPSETKTASKVMKPRVAKDSPPDSETVDGVFSLNSDPAKRKKYYEREDK